MIYGPETATMVGACVLMALAIMAIELRESGVAGWLMMAAAGTGGFALARVLA
jgi:hypothetical protein